jgi:MFS family permease
VTFPPGLRALNHAEFRRFYASQLVAQIGGWVQTVAQSWLVLSLTGSPLRLGLIGTLQFAPVLFLSIPAGAIVDRLPKRRVLLVTQATYATQAVGLCVLVATGVVEYWHVCALGLVVGITSAFDQPARQAFVLDLVGRDDLGNAVALNSAAFNAARIVGPAAAGLLIGRFGLAPAFAVNAVGFAAVIGTLLVLRDRSRPAPRGSASIVEEIAEGLVYAARTPLVVLVLSLVTVVSLFVFNFTVYVPLLARTVLGLGAEGFGFLMAWLGVGAVTGAFTVGAARPLPPAALFNAAAVALGALVGLSAARHFWVAAPLLAVTGFAGIILMAGCNTRLQLEAPPALRARLMGIYVLFTGGVFPIGAFLVGAVSERWGVSTAFLANGAAGLVALGAIRLWWRRHRRR